MGRLVILMVGMAIVGCGRSPQGAPPCDCSAKVADEAIRTEAVLTQLAVRLDRLEQVEAMRLPTAKERTAERTVQGDASAANLAATLDTIESRVDNLSETLKTLASESHRRESDLRAIHDRLDAVDQKCANGSDSGSSFPAVIARLNGDVETLKNQFRDLPYSQRSLDSLADLPSKVSDLTRRISDLERK